MNFLLVFVGGGIGSMLRYSIGLFMQKNATLPWATFISNVTACAVFAAAVWLAAHKGIASSSNMKILLLTGFCGGLSTFSSFGYETFLLFRQGWMLYAFLNIFFTTSVCLLIFYLFK